MNKLYKNMLIFLYIVSSFNLHAKSTDIIEEKEIKEKNCTQPIESRDNNIEKANKLKNQLLKKNFIDINTANAEELAEKLKGIGKKKALAIIEYREKFGKFTSISDLTNVKGIGQSFLRDNEDIIIISVNDE